MLGLLFRFTEEGSGAFFFPPFPYGKSRATLMPWLPQESSKAVNRWSQSPCCESGEEHGIKVQSSRKKKKKNTLSLTGAGGYTCRSLKAKPVGLQMSERVQLCNFIEIQKDIKHQVAFVWGKSLTQSLGLWKYFLWLFSLYRAPSPTRTRFPQKHCLPYRFLQVNWTSNLFSDNHPNSWRQAFQWQAIVYIYNFPYWGSPVLILWSALTRCGGPLFTSNQIIWICY